MRLKLHSTRLLVNDVSACTRFYRDILGFGARFDEEGSVYVELSAGDTFIALYDRRMMAEAVGKGDEPEMSAGKDRLLLSFEVNNVDETVRELEGKGVAMIAPPTDRPVWALRTAHFCDPEGTLIEINQPLSTGG
ncbi:MAG TPA: VOC family protein [Aggregatilineales bacterium]|nr:VOC family protein [Anaerolineales bacterium]HRE47637.1 VOC family protein [Aggregatilineales bacterium]